MSSRVVGGAEDVFTGEEGFRAVFDAAPVGAVLLGGGGAVLAANPAFCRFFGYDGDELGRLDCSALLHPSERDGFLAAIGRVADGRLPSVAMEVRWRRKEGDFVWGEAQVAPVSSKAGAARCLVVQVRALPERRQGVVESGGFGLKVLIQAIPEPVWLKDADGVFLACNAAFGLLYGASEEEIVGRRDDDFVSPELAAFFRGKDRAAMEAGRVCVNEEWVTYAGDGRRALWETVKTPIEDADGHVVGILGVARDITERRRMEDELRVRERYLRALLDNFPFMVWLKDTDSRLLAVNQAYADAAGVASGEEMFGKTDLDFFPRDLALKYRADDAEVLRTGRKKSLEESIAERGVRKWFETYKAPVVLDGKLIGTVGFSRDITERKQAELALHTREEAIRAVVENSPDMIARYDLALRRTYVNPAMAKMFGMTSGEMLERTPTEASTLLDLDAYMALLRRVLDCGKEIEAEVRFRNAAGEVRWGHSRMVPEFGPDGRIASILAIGRDIHSLKEAELRLEKSHAQLRELAARGEAAREEERRVIAREVHDELGQILTGLHLEMSVLCYKFGGGEPQLRSHVQGTLDLVDKALSVVRDVATALRPATLDLGIVSALEWLAGRFSANTGVACEVRADVKLPQMDDRRATALFRIAQESLTNVARHAAADRVEIVLDRQGEDYFLTVRDNGRGFDPACVKADSFGLVGLRERALMLGGDVSIASAPGHGCEVKVRIPIGEVATGA